MPDMKSVAEPTLVDLQITVDLTTLPHMVDHLAGNVFHDIADFSFAGLAT